MIQMTDQTQFLALHTGVPDQCYSQDEISDFYVQLLEQQGTRRDRAIRTIMNRSGVQFRYSVVPPDFFLESKTTQQRNDRYMEYAVPLGEQVIRAGLEQNDIDPQQIGSFTVVSCTGFNIPGLDLLLAGKLGLRPSLTRACILGMGCYAAFPGIRRALESVTAKPDQLALVLALEFCTLHLQFDDAVESVVSTSLFADGAAMAVIGKSTGASAASPMPKILDSETYCDYKTLDHMSFNVTDHGFRMYLSSYVPDVLAANICDFAEKLLARNGLHHRDIQHWVIHPGSRRIVEYIQQQLELTDAQTQFSYDILREYGNMSSATVLFILERLLQSGDPQPGDYGVMMAFGPGLTMESLLVQW
jgi:predicted naringenin-chalcone synthase